MSEQRILIIEDEDNLLTTIRYNLEREGYQVETAEDGERGLELVRQSKPDLVLLDLMLPKLDGLEVCRILRRESRVPIIMLTAKGEEVDRVVGLELGADDYVAKPFSMRELLARIRAALRRSQMPPNSPSSVQNEVLKAGELEVNLASHTARLRGQPLDLKPKEFELLTFFMSNRSRAFTRDQILDRLWGHDYYGDARTVDVHVRWLREKIESNPGSPVFIITVRGVGYRFEG